MTDAVAATLFFEARLPFGAASNASDAVDADLVALGRLDSIVDVTDVRLTTFVRFGAMGAELLDGILFDSEAVMEFLGAGIGTSNAGKPPR